MSASRWQFWIDVGGTFTDCIARLPDGSLLRHKLLSSGTTKGIVATGSSASEIQDGLRRGDPDGFWRGYRFCLLDRQGGILDSSVVKEHDRRTGMLRLATGLGRTPDHDQPYELTSGEPAPILAIRYLMGLRLEETIPSVSVRLGTTRGTNALITRRGAKTALVTTKGFGDILRIGYQNRPRLFELSIRKPAPLFSDVVEIDERISAEGDVLRAPVEETVRQQLVRLYETGAESLAICLLHAYRCPFHEELVESLARQVGFTEVSRSSQVAPLIKIVSRGDTTVMDAYLNPVLRSYVGRLSEALAQRTGGSTPTLNDQANASSDETDSLSDVRILTSAGGLVSASHFVGKDSILSGPAGGVVGFSRAAQAAGFDRAIGFDMGGTSTDVSRYDGRFELEYETEKAGVRVVAPMMAIETVAAGGGSICWFDGVKLAVGPDSSCAEPGPACYGRGGPLAVTDINLLLGRILPEHFPFPLDLAAAERRLEQIHAQVQRYARTSYRPLELADGFLRVANANMAKAIRSISIAKGYDPREYVLVAFGGAAPQHACAIANELGVDRILNHPDAGILSALGVGMADIVRHRVAGIYRPYSQETLRELDSTFQLLAEEATREVHEEGVPRERIRTVKSLDLRYQGVDASLTIVEPEDGDFAACYETQHRRLYGYVHKDRPLEIVAARVEVTGRSALALPSSQQVPRQIAPRSAQTTRAYFDGSPRPTDVFVRDELQPGHRILGPAIIIESMSTTVVEPNWTAEVFSGGELLLMKGEQPARAESKRATDGSKDEPTLSVHPSLNSPPDPVMLEIFNNHFAGIAEQMGITLRNTSGSVNVKERLDFSCALFTSDGRLVVNAPHIPVHLGAMSETVKCILKDNPTLRSGDVFVTNDPYRGGSHLPDVTVVTPVHEETTGELLFFSASRAHHAEIGGITPGSMPPFSRNLAEEGVLIHNFKVVDRGQSRLSKLRGLLVSAPHPTRGVDDNLADVSAQIAANFQGARDLLQLVQHFGWPVVKAYMRHIQYAAAHKMRNALSHLPDGRHEFVDHLDDGSPIAVTITIAGESAVIDFSGTGPVLASNLNANRAIVTAAVMYCLRCLIDEDIPLNEGVLVPVRVVVPECLLNPLASDRPEECAALAGGNVETSQRVVDVLLGALGVAAASQGTMNNLLFGDTSFGYYETVCGGAGATANERGADAVHTHMTNTRLTDPEVLEQRYPVRVREFSIRQGSGGTGRHRGGEGVLRRLEFLRSFDVSVLSQRRGPYPPYGLAGGGPGALGRNLLTRSDGTVEALSGTAQFTVSAGDILSVETPGGGGFGVPESADQPEAATE